MSTSTDEEMFKSVESELKFLMDEASVPRDIQKLVYSKGFTSVRIFAGIEESKGESKLFGTKIVTLFNKGNIVFSMGENKAGKFSLLKFRRFDFKNLS